MDTLLVLCTFLFGLLVGSFLNVVTLRFGFTEAARTRSGCQACGTQLHWYELLPVLSYIFLRGKCNTCGSALSIQYPLVELLTGGVFVLALYAALPIMGVMALVSFIGLLVCMSAFIALVVYDLRHTLVPTPFSLTFIVSALAVRASEAIMLHSAMPLYDALLGALIAGGFIWLLVFLTRGRGMGEGDIAVAAALGILFGAGRGIEVLTLAFWIGASVGILLIFLKKGIKMKSEVPFVPFLFVATLIGLSGIFSPFVFIASIMHGL